MGKMDNSGPRTALENIKGDYFLLNEEIVQKGLKESRESSRKRIILPIHRKQEAPVQRMINFLQPGTYIRPHKHSMPHASESIVVLKGGILFFIFEKDGEVKKIFKLSDQLAENVIDFEPGVWHNFIVMEQDTILFEVKRGPYDDQTDNTFANWSPEEFSLESKRYLKELLNYADVLY